jgi:hypothetical protein
VQPRQLPDGLLEVWFEGCDACDWVVLEVATYPERRIATQVPRDVTLVEAVSCPKYSCWCFTRIGRC